MHLDGQISRVSVPVQRSMDSYNWFESKEESPSYVWSRSTQEHISHFVFSYVSDVHHESLQCENSKRRTFHYLIVIRSAHSKWARDPKLCSWSPREGKRFVEVMYAANKLTTLPLNVGGVHSRWITLHLWCLHFLNVSLLKIIFFKKSNFPLYLHFPVKYYVYGLVQNRDFNHPEKLNNHWYQRKIWH